MVVTHSLKLRAEVTVGTGASPGRSYGVLCLGPAPSFHLDVIIFLEIISSTTITDFQEISRKLCYSGSHNDLLFVSRFVRRLLGRMCASLKECRGRYRTTHISSPEPVTKLPEISKVFTERNVAGFSGFLQRCSQRRIVRHEARSHHARGASRC